MADSMKDFENEINSSFQRLREGDIVDITVVGISDTELACDLNYYTEGVVPLKECSNDPSFSIRRDVNIGDTMKAMVTEPENRDGNVVLSIRKAHNILVWDDLEAAKESGKVFHVKVTDTFPAGVNCYVMGMRAFIPVSKLSLGHVDDTSSFAGKTLDAVIITCSRDENSLVLSAKLPAQEKALQEKTERISTFSPGTIVEGTIDRMEKYGVFITIADGIQGLCHISQITDRFIKSPKEVVKLGDHVRAKILSVDGDRISLSMKALQDVKEKEEAQYEIPDEYKASDDKDAEESDGNTPFADLLKDFKF